MFACCWSKIAIEFFVRNGIVPCRFFPTKFKVKSEMLFMKIQLIAVLISVIFLAGCGKNIHFSGKVEFTDGTPVESGTIYFEKADFVARGTIAPNGRYVLGSIGPKDGIPPGKYKVYIRGVVDKDAKTKNPLGMISSVSLIDNKYSNPETSGLSVEIPAERTLDIKLERLK